LIPHLVVSNGINFLFDLRESIFSSTSEHHDLAIEAEIHIAQAICKVFISTNPSLVHDSQMVSAIKLMTRRLLHSETHHELLIFEALLALINISVCFQGSQRDLKYVNDLIDVKCGPPSKGEG